MCLRFRRCPALRPPGREAYLAYAALETPNTTTRKVCGYCGVSTTVVAHGAGASCCRGCTPSPTHLPSRPFPSLPGPTIRRPGDPPGRPLTALHPTLLPVHMRCPAALALLQAVMLAFGEGSEGTARSEAGVAAVSPPGRHAWAPDGPASTRAALREPVGGRWKAQAGQRAPAPAYHRPPLAPCCRRARRCHRLHPQPPLPHLRRRLAGRLQVLRSGWLTLRAVLARLRPDLGRRMRAGAQGCALPPRSELAAVQGGG